MDTVLQRVIIPSRLLIGKYVFNLVEACVGNSDVGSGGVDTEIP